MIPLALIAATGLALGPGPGAPCPAAPAPEAGPALEAAIAVADSLVAAAVAEGLTPGAVLRVARDGRVLHECAFGHRQLYDYGMRRLDDPPPMQLSTVFDLASVTKVMATTFGVMLLVDRGAVDLDAPLHRYLPDFRGPHLDSITVRLLLQHASGLAQWQPLYYHASTPGETYDVIRAMPLEWGVGEGRHYSDLGFMLLGRLVERVSGQPLDRFLREELYDPLGLAVTGFLPKRRGITGFAATEHGNPYERRMVYDSTFGYRYHGDPAAWDGWRRHTLVGEVDDGNAWYANGGVAGHAGLFSTAAELGTLLDLLLQEGTHAGRTFLRPSTIRAFLTLDRYGHYLGWQHPAGLPAGSFAHSGFTGTYVLGVPEHGLSVVLLTNRQNMGADERGYFPNVGALQRAVGRVLAEGAGAGAAAGNRIARPRRGSGLRRRLDTGDGPVRLITRGDALHLPRGDS